MLNQLSIPSQSRSLIPQLDPSIQAHQARSNQLMAGASHGFESLSQYGKLQQAQAAAQAARQSAASSGVEWQGSGPPSTWGAIQRGIFAGESGGDYNALFGFSNRPGSRFANVRLTDMTVDDALNFANPKGEYGQWVNGQIGRVATPMGAYQIVGTTLRAAKEGLGLTGNERMSQSLQDALGYWIYQNQGVGAWEGYKGPIG